jgi:hypothetical protein
MAITRRTLLAAGMLLGATMIAPLARAADMKMTIAMSAASELPPNSSTGKGTADLTYDPATRTLSWTLTYADLTGPATAAHFHGPASPTTNGPVALPIGMKGMTSPDTGKTTLTEAQAADFLAGKWYVNVHTVANPGGEIRGNIPAAK